MKISYRREMKHNYLIIDPEALTWRNYECSMLAGNAIEGILRFQLRQVDDEIRFYYEITSRQPLSRILENRAIKSEEIRRLILGISAVLDRMEQYLLREDCILMKPEYLYVDPETFRIWLCPVPGLNRNFPEDYGKLLEYLLGKVDHQDKEGVVLAYSLYQETRKENYGMEDILRLLWPDGEHGRESHTAEQSERSAKDGAYRAKNQPEYADGHTDMRRKRERLTGAETAEPEAVGIWKRFCSWLAQRRGGKPEPEPVQVPFELLFGEEEMTQAGCCAEPEYDFSGNREPGGAKRDEGSPGQDTVLLADLAADGCGECRSLRALSDNMEDIPVPYFPFVIGKQQTIADYLLKRDTVSRLHLKIDRCGDGWVIQDLNSTNGTMVGGRLLENNEEAELHIGDEVRIAEYRYRFQ